MSEVTQLITAIGQGDDRAAAELLSLVYGELRRLARSKMASERSDHTLQATALVHEVYLRLLGENGPRLENRSHFFAAAAEAMRRILVEHARAKKSLKRGGSLHKQQLDKFPPLAWDCENSVDLLDLNEALERLNQVDSGTADLVKLLYFAGLNLDEAASALGLSRTTAYRRWQFARAWLHNALTGQPNRE